MHHRKSAASSKAEISTTTTTTRPILKRHVFNILTLHYFNGKDEKNVFYVREDRQTGIYFARRWILTLTALRSTPLS